MAIAIISVSANGPKKKELIGQFLERVSAGAQIIKTSHLYETFDNKELRAASFFSLVLSVETDMTARLFYEFLSQILMQLDGDEKLECLLVDYRGHIERTPKLTLPHPECHKKAYIMIPLSEMEPEWEHPVLKKKASELAQEVFWPGWGSFYASKESLLDF
ncbi:MAG: 2-amino-4-hydroxy-6-hydroxymethyldihydropteridine diphosphokinase [Oligoflexia bacterium]|nr:2-amino-4-hydroxy-6-hydroxymethyldihydropteridine diphosphokinase [Oligoflexia bacterium]